MGGNAVIVWYAEIELETPSKEVLVVQYRTHFIRSHRRRKLS